MTRLFLLFVALSILSALGAQKPVDRFPFESEPLAEPASEILGNQRIDLSTGFPLAIYNPDFPLSPASAEEMARQYLEAERATFGLSGEEVDQLRVFFSRESPAGTTVRFQQYVGQVPVHKGKIAVSITPDQRIGFVASSLVYGLSEAMATNPQIDATAARDLAAEAIGLRTAPSYENTDLVVYPNNNGGVLAQRVILESTDPLGSWHCFVDANNGEVFRIENNAHYYNHHDGQHEAKPTPVAPPVHLLLLDGTGKVFNPDPLSSANATYGDSGYTDNSDNNTPQLLAEQEVVSLRDISFDGTNYRLIGPWAEVQDFESPFRGLFSQPTPNWTGDRTDNSFEAVNVYYHIDASMRYLNVDLGLNIQPFNYPGGVRFDPSGLSGADNSYYSGSSQRLAFGDGGVDDAEDSDVIHHELGHGLHDWVTGGGLSQGQGLSEGSGDYWAASYNRSIDTWTSGDPAYHWVFRWDGHNPFWSGRRTNLSGTYPGALSGTIHSQGQFWATSMMLVWDAIGKEKTDRIFWEGLGMTNGSSNQNDAAVAAYLAAGALNYSNADRLTIHTILTTQGYTLPDFVLPVEWKSFTARGVDTRVELAWETASEIDHAYFVVERLVAGTQRYEAISERILAPTNSTATLGVRQYLYTDHRPFPGRNIYRIRQVDYDGTVGYSQLAAASIATTGGQWAVGPNPVVSRLHIRGTPSLPNRAELYNLAGRLVLEISAGRDGEISVLDVSGLRAGVYSLRLQRGDRRETHRIVRAE